MARTQVQGNLQPIVVLGDDPSKTHHVKTVEGVYRGRRPSPKYPESSLYDIETPDGTLVSVAGNAALASRMLDEYIGLYVWLAYVGQGRTKAGKPFAQVSVEIDFPDDDDANDGA